MALVIAPSISNIAEMRSADLVGMRHEWASNWGRGGLIAGGILLSPIFGFLMALVVDILNPHSPDEAAILSAVTTIDG